MICSCVSRDRSSQRTIVRRWKSAANPANTKPGYPRIELLQQSQITRQKPGLHLRHYPLRQLQAAGRVERNCNDSAQNASKESRYPLHRIVCPEQNAVAWPQPKLVISMRAAGAQLR